MYTVLTLEIFLKEAELFFTKISSCWFKELYSTRDSKSTGSFIETQIYEHLKDYSFPKGCSTKGLDFKSLNLDLKITSNKNPQSSTPFKNSEQKVYGLDHHLLIACYDREDNENIKETRLNFTRVSFVDKKYTGDKILTKKILEFLKFSSNKVEDISFLLGKNIPLLSREECNILAHKIIEIPPSEGKLSMQPALQWRLHYSNELLKDSDIKFGATSLTLNNG